MRWVVPLLFAAASCASSPATSSARVDAQQPVVTTAGDGTAAAAGGAGTQPAGFDTTSAVVTAADGTTCEICVWLAATSDQRVRGMMFVTDLGDAEAMAFRYPRPRTGTFWMKNTVMPLSIAFFDPDGEFMDSFDMMPCLVSDCPNYSTPEDFLVALEVPQGGLTALEVGPGSSLKLLDLPCN